MSAELSGEPCQCLECLNKMLSSINSWRGDCLVSFLSGSLAQPFKKRLCHFFVCFFGLEGSWGQPLGPNIPSPWATMLALHLDCSTTALTTPQKVLPIWKLVDLKILDYSDRMRTCISILTSAADQEALPCYVLNSIPVNSNKVILCIYL